MRRASSRGMTMIDAIVGTALMLVVFLGIVAAFHLSVDIVTSNKSRAGAIALANERMEYIRSLPYASVGTVGGIPAGPIAQSETVVFNGVTYTRRTLVIYGDDPKDGTDAADSNGIVEDYKMAKVDLAWTPRSGPVRHISLVTRLTTPTGMETTVPGGTLFISVTNAASQPLPGASVTIANASVSPAVNINTFTNASGTVQILGVPAAAGYQVTVTSPGYSTAQTYSVTVQNTNPSPGDLTVTNNHTTSATFPIDVLGSKTIQTWTMVKNGTWTDAFADETKVATSTNMTISAGEAELSDPSLAGTLQSVAIAPAGLNTWQQITTTDSTPVGTSIVYHVYDGSGTVLIPDAQLPGNAAGFAGGPLDLSSVSTSTYPSIRLGAELTGTASASPSISSWSVAYTYGPLPLPNIAFSMQGGKTIGSGPSGTLYKYAATSNTGPSASVTISNLEWDNYVVSIAAATGYDVASACNPQPESLSPGVSATSRFYLTAHTANSLLVDVRSAATGVLLPGATVALRGGAYAATSTADSCGQAFFGSLTGGSVYTLSVTAPSQQPYAADITVSGTMQQSVTLN